MFEKLRAWWARWMKDSPESDQQLAAEERALIDDPDGLGAELDQAEDAALMRGSPVVRRSFEEELERERRAD
jgi:hypothetical protein